MSSKGISTARDAGTIRVEAIGVYRVIGDQRIELDRMQYLHPTRSRVARHAPLAAALLAIVGSACSDDAVRNDAPDPTWLGADAPLALTTSTPPVDGLDPGVLFASEIPYGEDAHQVVDVFLPASDVPTPAILYVHGGGFTKGTRTDVYDGSGVGIRTALEAGVAFIGVDYRLLLDLDVETEGVRKSLHDARRALQFLRFHADELNIDPERIGIYGGSAGAGTSIWLAFHDDMAQHTNPDLIARESTRVVAASANQTQATYDVMRWADDVFAPQYPIVSNDLLLSVGSAVDLLLRFYGLPTTFRTDTDGLFARVYDDYFTAYRADLDMLALASSDDPPVYIATSGADIAPLAMGFDLLHHPLHAKTLYESAVAAGIEVEADIPAYGIASDYSGSIGFLLDRL